MNYEKELIVYLVCGNQLLFEEEYEIDCFFKAINMNKPENHIQIRTKSGHVFIVKDKITAYEILHHKKL